MKKKGVRISTKSLVTRRRSALGAALVVAVIATFGIAICRTATESRLCADAQKRVSSLFSIDDRSLVRFGNSNKSQPLKENDVQRFRQFRATFEENLTAKATVFLTKRSDGDWRAVASGLARWNVDARKAQRVFEAIAPENRNAANALFAKNGAFDYSTERAESAESARLALDVLQTLQNDVSDGRKFDESAANGIDAALDFLRELNDAPPTDFNEELNDGASEQKNVRSEAASFLWASDLDSDNPLDSLGVLAISDVVAVRTNGSRTAERSLKTASLLFFALTLLSFGGGWAPGTVVESLGGATAIRRAFDVFFKNLVAAPRRFLSAVAIAFAILSSVFLAQNPKFQRFDVASKRVLSPFDKILASVRLLN